MVDELAIKKTDIKIDKFRMSGFWDTPLDSILRNLRIDTLFFGGVNADHVACCAPCRTPISSATIA